MRRRDFIALSGAAAAALARPSRGFAQQTDRLVIGILSGTRLNPPEVEGVNAGLSELGYKDGENIRIEYRSAEGRYDQLPPLAADLVHHHVAVIVAIGGAVSAPAAKAATATIPIVFANGADPVKLGLVASLNQPGGNVTGVSFLVNSLAGKRAEMLHTLSPSAKSIGFLVNTANPSRESETREVQAAARLNGCELRVQTAADPAGIDSAFAQFSRMQIAAVSIAADAYFLGRREQIVADAAKYRIPAIYPREEYVLSGGLFSYAPRPADAYRLAGLYVGRILKGEKPSELPIQQSVKVYLTINLKTAKTLGIEIPAILLATADNVIE